MITILSHKNILCVLSIRCLSGESSIQSRIHPHIFFRRTTIHGDVCTQSANCKLEPAYIALMSERWKQNEIHSSIFATCEHFYQFLFGSSSERLDVHRKSLPTLTEIEVISCAVTIDHWPTVIDSLLSIYSIQSLPCHLSGRTGRFRKWREFIVFSIVIRKTYASYVELAIWFSVKFHKIRFASVGRTKINAANKDLYSIGVHTVSANILIRL